MKLAQALQVVTQALAAASLLAVAVAAPAATVASTTVPINPLRVDFYMEALCPYCANYTLSVLKPLFENKLMSYVELNAIAWGNAYVDEATGDFVCQHGPLECQLNKLFGCARAQHPMQDDWFPFLLCLEDLALKRDKQPLVVEAAAVKCALQAGMPPSKLLGCYNGELGTTLQRVAAERTASLVPPHRWVPWVVANGVPLLEDLDELQTYICVWVSGQLVGRERPSVCFEGPNKREKPALSQEAVVAQEPYPLCKRGNALPTSTNKGPASSGVQAQH